MKLSVLVLTLLCWAAVPSLSFAEDGHNHAEEGHKEAKKGDDHSDHAHDEAKEKHEEEGDDHSEDDDHGHKDDKSTNNKAGEVDEEDHEHAEAEEKHAHAEEEGSHDDHGEEGEDGHGEHGNSGVGPGKAIIEIAEEGNKFKLSKESESFLKINTEQIEPWGDNSFRVPKKYIVTYQNSKGLYVKSGGWFEIRGIKVLSSENGYSVVSGKGLSSDSTIAVTGLGFLRAAHLQASGQGGKGHAH